MSRSKAFGKVSETNQSSRTDHSGPPPIYATASGVNAALLAGNRDVLAQDEFGCPGGALRGVRIARQRQA
jgi:hypothetical protein